MAIHFWEHSKEGKKRGGHTLIWAVSTSGSLRMTNFTE